MYENTRGGFIGILVLVISAILALGGIFFYVNQKNNSPVPVATETTSVNDQTASAFNSTPDNTLATTTAMDSTHSTSSGQAGSPQASTTTKVVETKTSTVKKNSVSGNLSVDNSNSTPPPPVKTLPPPPPTPPKVTEPTLVVTPGVQPQQTLVLANAYDVPFTTVELTAVGGDVTVLSLEIERVGLASDRVFTAIGIEGIDTERAPNANHRYKTREYFTIKEGETRELVLFGDITDKDTLSTYNGQAPTLALVNIETTAKISGTLPISGTMHAVNSSITIGSGTMSNSGLDPGTNRTIYINSKNVTFSAVRIDMNSAEPTLLKTVAFTQNGSASSNDIDNVQICVLHKTDTKCQNVEADSGGRYYSADFADTVELDKGDSAEIYIKGDVLTTGSSRTIDFDIETSGDVIGYGLTYGNSFFIYSNGDSGAQSEGSFSSSEYPIYNAYAHTISGGAFNNIGK
jgi:hypothetical protein